MESSLNSERLERLRRAAIAQAKFRASLQKCRAEVGSTPMPSEVFSWPHLDDQVGGSQGLKRLLETPVDESNSQALKKKKEALFHATKVSKNFFSRA